MYSEKKPVKIIEMLPVFFVSKFVGPHFSHYIKSHIYIDIFGKYKGFFGREGWNGGAFVKIIFC